MDSKRIFLLILCIVVFSVAGCNQSLPEASGIQQSAWTEEELLDFFRGYAYADPAERTVTACAVFPDLFYGIAGVVQYTAEEEFGCGFDFIRNGQPLSLWLEAEPHSGSVLLYQGDGSVRSELLDAQGRAHIYTISLTAGEDGCELYIQSE